MSSRPTLELRNFRLLPNDIDALAFVVNSAADDAVGLDFGACSMEPECLDALSRCQCIHYLRWVDSAPLLIKMKTCNQHNFAYYDLE